MRLCIGDSGLAPLSSHLLRVHATNMSILSFNYSSTRLARMRHNERRYGVQVDHFTIYVINPVFSVIYTLLVAESLIPSLGSRRR